MLRAYARYMKQVKFNFESDYIAETLCNNLTIAARIVDYFYVSFDPKLTDTAEQRKDRESTNKESIINDLAGVENLNQDNIIRNYLSLIAATLRTNYFQHDDEGNLKSYFSFKMNPELIPDMPLPIPMFEIFVYSPRIEGVHLRGGKVARGGLRWSDRQEDFRTEVLGLVKAQQVKNAVIIPAGAKGGFVAKRLPVEASRDAVMAEGVACYRIFIEGLLDLTDNRIDGEVIAPREVVRRDSDDTYLVVAADKGTATFSDIANEISQRYDFWLGDAFASGGSVGYDHKKMGITAKGAWVSVQRHFREMGLNVQDEDFTVVGIGDMSGDVFGNGMLLSEHIQLLCAFNHLHIMIDPNPDTAISFIERKRLFELPRSSWSDYNAELISRGGGIFKRSAKSIAISPEMKERFGFEKNSLTPDALIKHILAAPYDLLWNGGIGTYMKATTESHGDVGDKANDSLRINGKDMQCKVIGEGGNLGFTQLARIEFSLHGGHCNTDFIDNAAGVDCSDHEVNIKILLNDIVTAGDMTVKQRNDLLAEMTDSISILVLDNNYRQTQAISMAEHEALERVNEYRRLIQSLEGCGRLNRQLEFIPDDERIIERKNDGKSLTRPELSVLISYVKSQLKEELVDSYITENDYISHFVETAFPARLNKQFSTLIHQHRLRREIIATQVANDLVNTMGITFVDRMVQSTGVSSTEVVAAFIAAADIFELQYYWQKIESLDYTVSSDIQMELMAGLIRMVRRATRWFIRNRRGLLDPAVETANFKQSIKELSRQQMAFISGTMREEWHHRTQSLIEAEVPEELARYVAGAPLLYPCLGIVEAAQEMKTSSLNVADVYFSLSQELELDWFARQVARLKVENYWQAMARESFRDDLEWQIRKITVGAMRCLDEQGDVGACIERWLEQQDVLVKRWRMMLVELHAIETPDFAMISVAIRELLDMAQSSEFGEVV
jgi:glutamate dehydrogenase